MTTKNIPKRVSGIKNPTPVNSAAKSGTLTLQILEATFKEDVDAAKKQKMDPYFEFEVNGNKLKTKVMKDAGTTPKWKDEIFKIKIEPKNHAEKITFMAYDDVPFKADKALGKTAPQKIGDLVTKN